MSGQAVTYAELMVAKDTARHQIKSKKTKRSVSAPQKEVTYADLNFQSASQVLQEDDKKHHCKALPPSPIEKLIVGLLGITCLALIISIIYVINIPSVKTPERNESSPIKVNQKDYHCSPCAKEWLTYSNSCYYISNEKKPWNESRTACESMKSHLLHIDNQEEMNFLNIFHIFTWIGLSRKTPEDPWEWTNGSVSSSEQFRIPLEKDKYCAYLHFEEKKVFAESCSEPKKYICKHWVHELS